MTTLCVHMFYNAAVVLIINGGALVCKHFNDTSISAQYRYLAHQMNCTTYKLCRHLTIVCTFHAHWFWTYKAWNTNSEFLLVLSEITYIFASNCIINGNVNIQTKIKMCHPRTLFKSHHRTAVYNWSMTTYKNYCCSLSPCLLVCDH